MSVLRCLLIVLLAWLPGVCPGPTAVAAEPGPTHTFAIGQDAFQLDGRPFVIRCGEIHFPRVPREYWKHRLQMCRALGLNTVCVYLFWNFHEWEQGRFDWSGQADVAEFCRLAQAEGLWVILRPGPYSCAEWEMGGLPWWLVKHDQIKLRSRDPRFLGPATRYLKEVGRVLAPLQITRGGPLLMVQVENEYGSFGKDVEYLGALRQALLDGGFEVPLFACNPAGALANGYREDLFQVVNFGKGGPQKSFEALRKYQKTGPLMNGEYYPAWFDTWGSRHKTGDLKAIVGDLEYMLGKGHSFSLYMAHGGTSFGMWAGADQPFNPDTSSYDYESPISEAGWVTPKFTAIRDVFAKHLLPGETIPPPPAANPVVAVPPFRLEEFAPILGNLPAPQTDPSPRTMEFHGQSRGCILYRTTLPAGPAGVLEAKEVHDFAWVSLDGRPLGVMDRRSRRFQIVVPARTSPARLDLLVEAMGRVNFGPGVFDRKGLHAPVRLTPANGQPAEVTGWEVFPLPLDDAQRAGLKYGPAVTPDQASPGFWRGGFTVEAPADTFLDLRTWGKGVVWINGHCLARFWNIGPTQTAYVPGPWLKAGRNEIVVLDLIGPRQPVLAGLTAPILDELHPELDFAHRTRAQGSPVLTLPPVHSGIFNGDSAWQEASFAKPASGRYLCFEALDAVDGKPYAAISELELADARGELIPNGAWKVLWTDSEESKTLTGDAENALDGQPATIWHTRVDARNPPGFPHRLVLDLGGTQTVGRIRYLARGGAADATGRIKNYRVHLGDQPFGLDLAAPGK